MSEISCIRLQAPIALSFHASRDELHVETDTTVIPAEFVDLPGTYSASSKRPSALSATRSRPLRRKANVALHRRRRSPRLPGVHQILHTEIQRIADTFKRDIGR